MIKKSKVLPITLVASLMLASAAFAAPNHNNNHGNNHTSKMDKQFLNRVDEDRAMDDIETLSEDIGVRIAASNEEYQAAKFIQKEFKKLGFQTKIQDFQYNGASKSSLKINNSDIAHKTMSNSNYSQGSLKGDIVECGLGNPEDFEGKDLNGKIALIQRGTTTFSQKAKAATDAGAKGVIIYNNTAGIVNGSLDANNSFVPTVGISQEDGEAIIAKLNSNETVTSELEVKAPEKITSWNVVATKKPDTKGNKHKGDKNDNDDIVHVTAHYDSVPKAPGANDNASGTAAMIEIAKSMNNMDIDKEIRFIACGAEEVGLRGSRAYVDSLSEDELNRSIANFNLDMVATAYEACSELAVYTNDGKENLVTEAMKESESKLSHKSTEYVSYDGTFDGPMGSSDHVPFNEAGIPSALFINVDPAKKDDPRSALEPYYHKPTDYTGNVSEERLERSIELVGLAILNTVNVD